MVEASRCRLIVSRADIRVAVTVIGKTVALSRQADSLCPGQAGGEQISVRGMTGQVKPEAAGSAGDGSGY